MIVAYGSLCKAYIVSPCNIWDIAKGRQRSMNGDSFCKIKLLTWDTWACTLVLCQTGHISWSDFQGCWLLSACFFNRWKLRVGFIFCLSKSEAIERMFLHKYVVKCVDSPGISVISNTFVYVLFNLWQENLKQLIDVVIPFLSKLKRMTSFPLLFSDLWCHFSVEKWWNSWTRAAAQSTIPVYQTMHFFMEFFQQHLVLQYLQLNLIWK